MSADPLRLLDRVFGEPFPWTGAVRPLAPDDVLDSATWHTIKHRFLGDFLGSTTLVAYLEDLRLASAEALGRGTVVVGTDSKSSNQRVGLILRLGPQGSPCTHVTYRPGDHLFVAYDPQRDVVVTGFPLRHWAVQSGYPAWHNRTVVTR